MSIIHNALKKTQKELKIKSGTSSQETPQPKSNEDISKLYETLHQSSPSSSSKFQKEDRQKPKPERPAETGKNKTTQIIITLIFVFAFAVGVMAYFFPKYLPHSFSQSINPKTKTEGTAIAPEAKKMYDQNQIVVNGTVVMDEKRMALINDNFYEIGDVINGKKIMNIALDRVEFLDEQGKTLTLKVKGKR